jgi:hypothetical protein
MTLLRDPLLHFLAGGLALFVLFDLVGDGAGERNDVIVVDRAALLGFVQARTKVFEPSVAAARLDALTPEERRRLARDFVQEEALHREALALGLDVDDYVIRRRLVQKLEFIAQGFAEAEIALGEEDVVRYFEAHRADYRVAPWATFTHVFFDAEQRGSEAALEEARRALPLLQAEGVSFPGATAWGDRFLYHRNYVERTPDFVASHFGPAMAEAVFALAPDATLWRGPFISPYGAHLVLLTDLHEARDPALQEIRERVEGDARAALVRERQAEAVDAIVERYEIRFEDAEPQGG